MSLNSNKTIREDDAIECFRTLKEHFEYGWRIKNIDFLIEVLNQTKEYLRHLEK